MNSRTNGKKMTLVGYQTENYQEIVNIEYVNNVIIDNPNITTFVFKKGFYFMNNKMLIDRPDIKIYGEDAESTHIIQVGEFDGLDVEGNGFKMKNISIHVEKDYKVALSVAGVNNSVVNKCYFYGNTKTFTIFYAGPKINAGQQTIASYTNSNLDDGNKFINNVVYTLWTGDCVSFSLQINGLFENNIIRGGKLALYMCKNTKVTNNNIFDSIGSGIHISLPSHDIDITKNKIYECTEANIKINNQGEHGVFQKSDYNINILDNFMYDTDYIAIEMNNGCAININNNTMIGTDKSAFYCLNSDNIVMNDNKLVGFSIGIELLNATNCVINKNQFYSIYPNETTHFVSEQLVNTQNRIVNNIIKGRFTSNELFKNQNIIDNIYDNNKYEKYYNRKEELVIIKFK
jgi:hypothetical protein